jgi:hypothetical protein
MRTKHKIALAVVIVGFVGAALSWYLIKKHPCPDCLESAKINLNQAAESATVTSTLAIVSSPSPTANLIYKNSKYGFEITFSEVWTGYVVNEKPAPSGTTVLAELDVVMPQGAIPLVFYVYPISAAGTELVGTQISQDGQYIFTYRTDDSLSSSTSTITEKEIADRLATFELTK